ncbi:DEAD/DEAH box helicase [Bosea beijingensis]|uniref:DEAD/DEAH box helicase n=1 Tax=Bosea beijingensis TaxID=3068632 RepID=UPI002741CCA8|nr:DEAD/DEAH box helicase family protein [Bosea sp. REN20]
MSYFADNQLLLRPLDGPNTGLRPGQLGGLHSVLAHFSVYDEPAIVSLPTGYGKTALLMALPFVLKARRLLVVEPSDALRRQTASHLKELSTLKRLGAAAEETPNPNVISQKGSPADAQEWARLQTADAVVSTPQSISPAVAAGAPDDLFDLIIFDEAHHAPAETWAAFLSHYRNAKFVFLTATPFRRDRKVIPGRMAYWYPVSRAAKERAFGRVLFRSVRVANDQDDQQIDVAIAAGAVAQLRADREAGFDHRLFARASSISAARDLVGVYERAGARVRAIDSHIPKKTQDEVERALIVGELDGVVCVDMFGEGYDFPKLKVAALHAPHRSLVPMLQFIGRFARTTDARTGDATLIAHLGRLQAASKRLFQEGIDIADMIDAVAQEQLAEAEADREVLELLKTRQQADSDYDSVTPLLLELYAHAQIFECSVQPDFERFEDTIGRNLRIVKQWLSENGLVALILTIDTSPPNWATSDVLVNIRHDAFLMAYNEASKLCFIGSTRRTDRIYLDLMQTACRDQHRQISFERTRQALIGLDSLRFYNVGLRNTALNSQAETYRTMTGPAAERAITAGDARAYSQGHFFGSGVGKDDERETIGASSSSRIWSNQRLTVAEYISWITELNRRLNSTANITPSKLDIIQHARTLRTLPEIVIAAGWHKQAYRLAPRIRFRLTENDQWQIGQITDLELGDFQISAQRDRLQFAAKTDAYAVQFDYRLTGGNLIVQTGAGELQILASFEDWIDLALWMSLHPPVFYASDKTSFQGVNLIGAAPTVITRLAEGDAEAADWAGCNIQIEFDRTKADGALTVHEALERRLSAAAGVQALFYDHRSGEAADYVSIIRDDDGTVRVQLYHCKGAGGAPSGGRVDDVYEVAGQMLKSVAYCEPSILLDHIDHRVNAGRHRTPSRFVIGDAAMARTIIEAAPATGLVFEIYGVQPGISLAAVDEHLADLMAYGLDYVQRGGAARAMWLLSA